MPVPDVGASGTGGATNIPNGRGSRILPDPGPWPLNALSWSSDHT